MGRTRCYKDDMTSAVIPKNKVPWPALAGLGGFWFAASRMLGPQWSTYEQYNYGWAVPFLCAYLLANRWPDRPAATQPATGTGLAALTIFGLLLLPTRIIVEANPIWRFGSWAMGIELAGLTLAVFYLIGGRGWARHFGFAAVFFLVAVPWPSAIETSIVQNLMRLNTGIVVELLTALGIPALQEGNVVRIAAGPVGIDEACSGIRSLQATLMISLFFGELYRLRAGRRIWVVVAGACIAYFCNICRTFLLVYVCYKSGIAALPKWHDPTGIAILMICFTGLWLVSMKLRAGKSPPPASREPWPGFSPRSLGAMLVIFLAAVEGGTAAWFGRFDRANPNLTNWSVDWSANPNARAVEISTETSAIMKFDEGKSMQWPERDGTTWQGFYFRWGPAQSLFDRVRVQCAKTHRPEICLSAAGLKLEQYRGTLDFDANGIVLPFRSYRFEQNGSPLFVYFCAWEDGSRGQGANLRENNSARLQAALSGSRSVSQRVIELAVWGCADEKQADESLRRQIGLMIRR